MIRFFKQLSTATKVFLIAGVVMILYGFICRWCNIYFAWESKYLGVVVLLFGLLSLFSERIKFKKSKRLTPTGERIGLWLTLFVLSLQTVILLIFPFSDAYAEAKRFLLTVPQIKEEVGDIKGFGLLPLGSIHVQTNSEGKSGEATILITVKGSKKYKDFTVNVVKEVDQPDWDVKSVD